MYKLKFTILQQEILRLFFFKAGVTLNQRAIARFLKVSQPAIVKAIPGLEKKNLIKTKQDKDSRRWSIELNRDSQKVMQLKRADNLRQIYDSALAEYLEDNFPGATLILFGSYSRGDDTLNSDIDLAVIGRKEQHLNLDKFGKMLERKITINFYDSLKSLAKEMKENLCNGIVLFGGIEF